MRELVGVYVDPRADDRRSFHVLIVDDEPEIVSALERLIEHELPNVRVSTAHDGAEALRIVADGTVDLILTDQRMPGISGIDMLRNARARSPGTRAILMTAYADLDLALNALNEKLVTRLLQKPLESSLLVGAIREALGELRKDELRGEAFTRVMEHVKG